MPFHRRDNSLWNFAVMRARCRGRRHSGSFMAATPNRHFSIAMSVAPVSTIDHLVNGGRIEAPVIALRQESQIRRLGFELGAERAGAFAIVAVTSGAVVHV